MQGLKVALSKEESKNSGLEGLIYQSQGRLIKEENETTRTPYEIFEKMKYDLKLTEKDLLFLSATYLNNNNNYAEVMRGFKCGKLDIEKKYKPENYNKDSFGKYKIVLSEKDKRKLDFQILLYAIKSEELLRDYELTDLSLTKNHLNSIKNKYTYTDLVFEFIPDLWGMRRPNNEGFIGSLVAVNDHNLLKSQVESGKITLTAAIDFILKNEYKDYFSERML